MRSLERRFKNLQQKRPQVSSLLNFGAALQGQRFSEDAIHRWFNKVVEKGDYENRDKRAILRYLVSLSGLEGNRNRALIAS
jgi:hypothetical protein